MDAPHPSNFFAIFEGESVVELEGAISFGQRFICTTESENEKLPDIREVSTLDEIVPVETEKQDSPAKQIQSKSTTVINQAQITAMEDESGQDSSNGDQDDDDDFTLGDLDLSTVPRSRSKRRGRSNSAAVCGRARAPRKAIHSASPSGSSPPPRQTQSTSKRSQAPTVAADSTSKRMNAANKS